MITVPDLVSTLEPAEHLLVITPPGGSGRYGLWLPFSDATVVEADSEGIPGAGHPEGPLDSIVIESPAADVSWADRVLSELGPAISQTSAVVLALVPEYASITTADHSPPALPRLRDFRVVRVGLLGGAVSFVLSRCADASLSADADAAMVAAITSLTLELDSLAARDRQESGTGQRARTQAAAIFELRDEVHRLSAELASTRQELTQRTREYRALRYSRLGRITVGYWRFRRKVAAWKAARALRAKAAGQAA